jgi:hypothetical protein
MADPKASAINVALWDMSGAPIDPATLDRIYAFVEEIAVEENLLWTAATAFEEKPDE